MVGFLLLGALGAVALGGIGYGGYHLVKKIISGIKTIKEKKKEKEDEKNTPEKEQKKENSTEDTLEQLKLKDIEKRFKFWQLNDIYSNFENKNYVRYYNENIKRTKNPHRLTLVSNVLRYVEENYGPEVAKQITFDNINHFWSDTMYFNSRVFDPELGFHVLKKTKLLEFRDKEFWFYYPDGKQGHYTRQNLGAGLSLLDKKLEHLGAKRITREQYEKKLADKVRQREKKIKDNDGYVRELSYNVR